MRLKTKPDKPECKIICNDVNNSNSLLYEVSKILRNPKYRELYEDFVMKVNHHDTCENLLRISLDYVELIFIYDPFGVSMMANIDDDDLEEDDYEET